MEQVKEGWVIGGRHGCKGAWSVDGFDGFISVKKLYHICKDRETQVVPFSEISWKGPSKRTVDTDTSIPCIIAKGAENPHGMPYRMCDGRNRMTKMIFAERKEEAEFYVISKEEFDSLFVIEL